jgi:hypothetical protein
MEQEAIILLVGNCVLFGDYLLVVKPYIESFCIIPHPRFMPMYLYGFAHMFAQNF